MFCEYCGHKLESSDKFCMKCGKPVIVIDNNISTTNQRTSLNDKWWRRLLNVLYVVAYFPLLIILPITWSVSSSSYVGYFGGESHYEDTYGMAFWYSILA